MLKLTELERLIMLYTGDRPDGTRFQGAMGLEHDDHQRLTNLLIAELDVMDKNLIAANETIGEITEDVQRLENENVSLANQIQTLLWRLSQVGK